MKRRTSIQLYLQDYIWGVYPISIQCERDYQTQFHLYFQKSLQIISQHQTSKNRISKGQVVSFGPPQCIQPFRVQSDKNMEYKWSLYIKRKDFAGNNQEFLENISIDLKDEWSQYRSQDKDSKRNCFKRMVCFEKMKIKFSFLIIIAINNSDLDQAAQRYLMGKQSSSSLLKSQSKIEQHKRPKSEKKIVLESRMSTQSKQYYAEKQNKVEVPHKKFLTEVEADSSVRSIPLYPLSAQNSSVKHEQTEFLHPSPSKVDNQEIKLSNSDIEIGNQIEEKVQVIQKRKPSNQSFLTVFEKGQQETKVQKSIRMTSSQLLNSKGDIIVPIYKRKSVIFVVLAFLLLIVGQIFFMNLQEEPMKKNKTIKQKKQRKQPKKPKEAPKKQKKKKIKAKR